MEATDTDRIYYAQVVTNVGDPVMLILDSHYDHDTGHEPGNVIATLDVEDWAKVEPLGVIDWDRMLARIGFSRTDDWQTADFGATATIKATP